MTANHLPALPKPEQPAEALRSPSRGEIGTVEGFSRVKNSLQIPPRTSMLPA